MRFEPAKIPGLYVIELSPHSDERGSFARTFCVEEFRAAGLPEAWCQSSVSINRRRGTLRGLHYQREPYGETKLVRCTRGSLFDVVVDLRPASPTFRQWLGYELTDRNHRQLVIPPGCAHGFITLADETDVLYQMDRPQVADAASGVRWNDPAFDIAWPLRPVVMSARDRDYADWQPDAAPLRRAA